MNKRIQLIALLALPFSVMAQTAITWDGTDSTDFATGGNWVGDTAPANDLTSSLATFSGAATGNQPILATDQSIYGFDFQSGGWTLSGAQFTIGAGGIANTGNNEVTAGLALNGNSIFSSASGEKLTLNTSINGRNGAATFGTAANTGTVELGGTGDNGYFSTTVNYGTLILNKNSTTGSSAFNLAVDSGATVQFGDNLVSRDNSGGRGQIYGTATVNGTMDLNGQGLTSDDTYNWSMGGLSGSGTVVNNGSGSAQISVVNGAFSGQLNDGTSTTALRVFGTSTLSWSGGGDFSGGTIIEGHIRTSGSLGSGAITLDTGLLQNYNGATTLENDLVVGANGGQMKAGWSSDLIINGEVAGSGNMTIDGDSGTVVLANDANTYDGAINLAAANSTLSVASLGDGATISGNADATLTFTGAIALDTVSAFAGTTTLGNGGAFTGSGTLTGDLTLSAGSGLDINETLSVAGLVNLNSGDAFGIANILGLSETTADGLYTLIDTTATDFSSLGLSNFGAENAVSIGGDKSAYFQNGSLQVVVIPEPATLGLIAACGGALLFIRRRFMI